MHFMLRWTTRTTPNTFSVPPFAQRHLTVGATTNSTVLQDGTFILFSFVFFLSVFDVSVGKARAHLVSHFTSVVKTT